MKPKKFAIVLTLALALHRLASAQTNVMSTNESVGMTVSNQTVEVATTNAATNMAVTVTTSNETAVAVSTNQSGNEVVSNETTTVTTNVQPVSQTVSNESTVAGTNPMAGAMESNVTAAVAASNETAGATSVTNAAADTNSMPVATIPLISFQDIPITSAIENLTRLAGINYLLDPKIAYGQPDQNGQVKPEPTLSIRWENVTAEQALLALLDNYGLQLVEDKKTKIARITIKDPTAPPPLFTQVVQLKYASVSNMQAAVESTLSDKRSRVVIDSRTSQLVVVATEPEQDAVNALVDQLDKPTRQVLIETRLVELQSNPSTTKGIDWSGTLAAQNISFGNGLVNASSLATTLIPGAPVSTTQTTPSGNPITTTTTPGSSSSTVLSTTPQGATSSGGVALNTASGLSPNIGFLSADGLHVVLSFLNSSTEAKVVSTPRIVTLDNEEANISVTTAFPVFNVTAGTANSAGGSQIGYTNVGVVLDVTPRISANNYIWLKVTPQVSALDGISTKTVAGEVFQADIFDYRTVDTQVLIPNANTLVMGGLVQDNPTANYTKVPILGDIPILGYAFRSENKSANKDDLLIFITPTILKDEDFEPTQTSFLTNPEANEEKMNLHMGSSWNNAKPHDWSNPDSGSAVENTSYDKPTPSTNSVPMDVLTTQ